MSFTTPIRQGFDMAQIGLLQELSRIFGMSENQLINFLILAYFTHNHRLNRTFAIHYKSLRLSKGLRRRLEAEAKRLGVTQASCLRLILEYMVAHSTEIEALRREAKEDSNLPQTHDRARSFQIAGKQKYIDDKRLKPENFPDTELPPEEVVEDALTYLDDAGEGDGDE